MTAIYPYLTGFVTILGSWLLADFLTGIAHWAQDKLLTFEPKNKWLRGIKADNDLHHAKPAAMLRFTWWENINTSAPYTWPTAAVLFWLGAPPLIYLAIFFGSFANLIHRFSHMPKGKLNRFLRFMQWTGLFISIEHHREHHFDRNGVIRKEDTTVRYCPMTDWVNPILDRIRFWSALEFICRARR